MTSKSQLENHLQDHLPYELLMLRYSHGRMNIESDPLIWNAMYECFCMHARNLWDFLNNAGTSNNLKVKEFSRSFEASYNPEVQRILNQDMQTQVFHFGKSRGSDDAEKVNLARCKTVFDYIENNFVAFLAADFDDPALKGEFREERAQPDKVQDLIKTQQELIRNIGPASASSNPSYSLTSPTRRSSD